MREDKNTTLALVQQFTLGSRITETEAIKLESALEQDPADMHTRAKLIGFYAVDRKGLASELLKHQIWIIEHCPEHELATLAVSRAARLRRFAPEAYREMKQKWLEKLELRQSPVKAYINAANFFILNEDEQYAETALKKALLREPENTTILDKLSKVLETISRKANGNRDEEAFLLSTRAFESEADPFKRFSMLIRLPLLALRLNNLAVAESTAYELIELASQNKDDSANYGFAIHMAHTVLGILDCRANKLESAIDHLHKSIRVPECFALITAGPNLELAENLLEAGYSNEVLKFIDRCEQIDFDTVHKVEIRMLRDLIVD